MKNIIFKFLVLIFVSGVTFAQVPDKNLPDTELTKEQAELRINDYQNKVNKLESNLNELNTKLENLKSELDNTNQSLDDCNDELKRLLGVTDADFAAFRQKLGVIEGKVREMQRLNDSQLLARQDEVAQLENDLNDLRKNKISLLPEFYNKIIALAKDIKGLYREKKIDTYTVGTWAEDRDCLWNIAGKMEIYADPFMWPKIWQANKDIIRNPDIIFPGQVLKIAPKGPKTSEEIKAERKYYRMKKEQQANDTGVTAGEQDE